MTPFEVAERVVAVLALAVLAVVSVGLLVERAERAAVDRRALVVACAARDVLAVRLTSPAVPLTARQIAAYRQAFTDLAAACPPDTPRPGGTPP